MGTREHKQQAPKRVTIGIITVSTTRALVDDSSGNWINRQAANEGHEVIYHQVITDDVQIIATTLKNVIRHQRPQVILMTGGTGITEKMLPSKR